MRRFRDGGLDLRAVEEKSRRPLSNPQAVTPEVEDWIVQARKAMPWRGPRKLRASGQRIEVVGGAAPDGGIRTQ